MADADAAVEASKKPPEDAGPRIIGEGLVIDEWVSHLIVRSKILGHVSLKWIVYLLSISLV